MGLSLGSGLRQKQDLTAEPARGSSGTDRRIRSQALATAASNRSAEIASIELVARPKEPKN
jgi:hypothetical protein